MAEIGTNSFKQNIHRKPPAYIQTGGFIIIQLYISD